MLRSCAFLGYAWGAIYPMGGEYVQQTVTTVIKSNIHSFIHSCCADMKSYEVSCCGGHRRRRRTPRISAFPVAVHQGDKLSCAVGPDPNHPCVDLESYRGLEHSCLPTFLSQRLSDGFAPRLPGRDAL